MGQRDTRGLLTERSHINAWHVAQDAAQFSSAVSILESPRNHLLRQRFSRESVHRVCTKN